MTGRLFIISGCSGVGKGTIIKQFIDKNPDVKLSVSATTRKPRVGEKNGVNYFFISKDEFVKSVQNDEFLEYAEFSGNMYGTKKDYVEENLKDGSDVILEIEVQGAKQVKDKMPKSVSVFIMPPSVEELELRLRGRHTEDEESIQRRLKEAKREMKAGEDFDYKVINDNLLDAINELQKIFDAERDKNADG